MLSQPPQLCAVSVSSFFGMTQTSSPQPRRYLDDCFLHCPDQKWQGTWVENTSVVIGGGSVVATFAGKEC